MGDLFSPVQSDDEIIRLSKIKTLATLFILCFIDVA
jgi:hypothetical protein